MKATASELRRLGCLEVLNDGQLAELAPHCESITLDVGDALPRRGEPRDTAPGLGLLLVGRLDVFFDGMSVGRVDEGELFFERSALLGATLSAKMRAVVPSRVLVVPTSLIKRLRALELASDELNLRQPWKLDIYDVRYDDVSVFESGRRGVYSLLVHEACLQSLVRVERTNARVASISRAKPRPVRTRNWFQGLLARFKPAPDAPSPIERLRRLPGLQDAEEGMLRQLAARFEPVRVDQDEALFHEGDEADACYLVAEGAMDVLRRTDSGGAECLTTIGPGALVGINALFLARPRNATLVARAPSVLWRMSSKDVGERHWPSAMGVRWRETLLAVLASQITAANLALQRASDAPDDDTAIEALYTAESALFGDIRTDDP